MWVSFFAASFALIALLYIPGYFAMRFFQVGAFAALLSAPLISVAGYVLLGIIYDFAGISVSWIAIVFPVLALGVVLYLLASRKPSNLIMAGSRFRWLSLACYVGFGVLVVIYFYVRCLDGPDSFAQIFDNGAHLNMIRSFADSGHFSILNPGEYLDGTIDGQSPSIEGGFSFYPAAWHVVSALVCNALSISAAVAENVSNFVFTGVVFPASVCLLFNYLFVSKMRVVICGAACCLAFEAFPWGMMLFGPLYSNMMAFCVLPLALFCVAVLFEFDKKEMPRRFILFVIAGFVLGAAQPNAIFTALVLFLPYCTARIYSVVFETSKSKIKAIAFGAGFAVLICLLWVALWSSAAFNAVVTYPWPSFTGKMQAVINVFTLSLRDAPAQLVLGFFVLLGMLSSLFYKNARWAVWSYGFAAAIYCVAASTDGALKSLLSGFWYNDSYRLASMLALSALPLASMGLSSAIGVIQFVFGKASPNGEQRNKTFAGLTVLFPFLALTFIPSHSLNGIANVDTAFSRVDGGLTWLADPANRKYTIEESNFSEQARSVVAEDPGVVINFPYDGSVFSYGADDLDIYYRTFYSFGGDDETKESRLLRTSLDEIGSDDEVKAAAETANVKYVLLLDVEDEGETIHEDLYSDKQYGDWKGLLDITPETKGFDLVLSEGDMRLYKITM